MIIILSCEVTEGRKKPHVFLMLARLKTEVQKAHSFNSVEIAR